MDNDQKITISVNLLSKHRILSQRGPKLRRVKGLWFGASYCFYEGYVSDLCDLPYCRESSVSGTQGFCDKCRFYIYCRIARNSIGYKIRRLFDRICDSIMFYRICDISFKF